MEHAKEHKSSSLRLNELMKRHNMRPPELTMFGNVEIFTQVFKRVQKNLKPNEFLKAEFKSSMCVDALNSKQQIRNNILEIGHKHLLKLFNDYESKQLLVNLLKKYIRRRRNALIARSGCYSSSH